MVYECDILPTAENSIKMAGEQRSLILEEILSENQLKDVMDKSLGKDISWVVKKSEVRPMEGMPGYLGDHLKAVVHVDVQGEEKKVHLFLKLMPVYNKPKAKHIDGSNFYRREKLMFEILEEIGPNPWCVQAYIYTDTMLVMPDLSLDGYSTRQCLKVLDTEHVFLTTTAVAQFHAAFVNYETKKSLELSLPYRTPQEYDDILAEPAFCDSPFLRSCSKLSANLIKHLSAKPYRNVEGLESKLTKLYLDACDSLTEYKETLNVLLHRDLWVNNIMYKYHNNVPINCILVDYQCLRYGPPAFDIMMFLYLTTDRRFRQEREKDVFDHYFSIFMDNLNEDSKKRIEELGYDKESFLNWCEKGRMFGMFGAIAIFPFILMEPDFALKTLHDPETYDKYLNKDRTEPVVQHARDCEAYKHRNMEVTEEFVETYVLNQI